jgi:hypothetical protein
MGQTIRLSGSCLVVLGVVALCSICASAQNSDHDTATSPQLTPQTKELPTSQNKIRVQTNQVVAAVTVLNKHGDLVLDLAQSDFHVYDNGAEQAIEHWDLGGDPLAVALVIETSSHIQMMAPVIHGMSSIFTETVMALNGEAAVMTYDSTVEVRQPFTDDHDAIASAIAGVQFEAPEMRLYDAMAEAVDLLKVRPVKYRRVMLIVGESQDIASDAKLGLVLRDAELANIAIYAVGPSSSTADLRFGPKHKESSIRPGCFRGRPVRGRCRCPLMAARRADPSIPYRWRFGWSLAAQMRSRIISWRWLRRRPGECTIARCAIARFARRWTASAASCTRSTS